MQPGWPAQRRHQRPDRAAPPFRKTERRTISMWGEHLMTRRSKKSASFGWGETSAGLVRAVARGVPGRLDYLMGGKTLFLVLAGRRLSRLEPCECEKVAAGRAR
jgi:hypothetical protein